MACRQSLVHIINQQYNSTASLSSSLSSPWVTGPYPPGLTCISHRASRVFGFILPDRYYEASRWTWRFFDFYSRSVLGILTIHLLLFSCLHPPGRFDRTIICSICKLLDHPCFCHPGQKLLQLDFPLSLTSSATRLELYVANLAQRTGLVPCLSISCVLDVPNSLYLVVYPSLCVTFFPRIYNL